MMTDGEFSRLFLAPEPKLQALTAALKTKLEQLTRRAWSNDPDLSRPALEKLELVMEILGAE